MRYLVGFICVLALGVMECGETAGTSGSGGTAGDGGQGGSAGSAGTATLSVFVFETGGGFGPLEGVQLCETDTTNCAMTDDGGNAAVDLPVDREISYTLHKPGYVPHLRADVLSVDGSYVPTSMSTDANTSSQYERVMSPYPMQGTGSIVAQAFSDELGIRPIAGATFELISAAGKAHYGDDDGNWSLNLSATTTQGSGGFTEVSPGEHEMAISGAVENCQVLRGWPSDSGNTMRVPVREGHHTISRWFCPDEPK
jgi:hypothetical protein